jgi:hypothetical protein
MNSRWKNLIDLTSLIFLLTILLGTKSVHAQELVHTYSKTLYSPTDSFAVRFSYSSDKIYLGFKDKDTVDMGGDGAIGLYATIFHGRDSVNIPYSNLPYTEAYWIHLSSPKSNTVYHLHFNGVIGAFTQDYIREYTNKTQFLIPEVFELANIIWALSPTGQRANNLNKESDYYKRVIAYFQPYLNDPLFTKLNFHSDDMHKYYDFRDNSIVYSFKNGKLVSEGPYYYVSGNNWNDHNSLFKELLPLIEDFVNKSKFKEFYKDNEKYYAKQIEEEQLVMPVKKMWSWLEVQFPSRYDAYKVVFSPLIKSTHSTQNYTTYTNNTSFSETVMFVSGPDIFDNNRHLTPSQKEGLESGIVFTEIDHNYVNPISYRYKRLIDSIFSRRDIWTSPGGDVSFYDNPMSVFNEYMTHAVFCLYVLDNFSQTDADFIIKARESLMVNIRHYIKFKEFNDTLLDIYKRDKTVKVSSLFEQMLVWCKGQI